MSGWSFADARLPPLSDTFVSFRTKSEASRSCRRSHSLAGYIPQKYQFKVIDVDSWKPRSRTLEQRPAELERPRQLRAPPRTHSDCLVGTAEDGETVESLSSDASSSEMQMLLNGSMAAASSGTTAFTATASAAVPATSGQGAGRGNDGEASASGCEAEAKSNPAGALSSSGTFRTAAEGPTARTCQRNPAWNGRTYAGSTSQEGVEQATSQDSMLGSRQYGTVGVASARSQPQLATGAGRSLGRQDTADSASVVRLSLSDLLSNEAMGQSRQSQASSAQDPRELVDVVEAPESAQKSEASQHSSDSRWSSRRNADRLAQSIVQEGATTLMVRNLPAKLTTQVLVDALCSSGFVGQFDFCFVPTHFSRSEGASFGFVNFVSPESAFELARSWHGATAFGRTIVPRCMKVSIAEVQGKAANVSKWSASARKAVRSPALRPFIA